MHHFSVYSLNTTGTSKTLCIMFCPNAFKIAYNSTIYDLSANMYSNFKNTAAKVVSVSPYYSADSSHISLGFTTIISQTNKIVYILSYQVNITYDFSLH